MLISSAGALRKRCRCRGRLNRVGKRCLGVGLAGVTWFRASAWDQTSPSGCSRPRETPRQWTWHEAQSGGSPVGAAVAPRTMPSAASIEPMARPVKPSPTIGQEVSSLHRSHPKDSFCAQRRALDDDRHRIVTKSLWLNNTLNQALTHPVLRLFTSLQLAAPRRPGRRLVPLHHSPAATTRARTPCTNEGLGPVRGRSDMTSGSRT